MLFIIFFNLLLAKSRDGLFEVEDPGIYSTFMISFILLNSLENLVLKNLCLLNSEKLALSSGLNLSILHKKSLITYFSDP